MDPGFAYQIKSNINDNNVLDKFCILYVESKSTQAIRKNKNMTSTINKLKKVHVNLWGLYDFFSQSGSTYTVIFMYEYTQKT